MVAVHVKPGLKPIDHPAPKRKIHRLFNRTSRADLFFQFDSTTLSKIAAETLSCSRAGHL